MNLFWFLFNVGLFGWNMIGILGMLFDRFGDVLIIFTKITQVVLLFPLRPQRFLLARLRSSKERFYRVGYRTSEPYLKGHRILAGLGLLVWALVSCTNFVLLWIGITVSELLFSSILDIFRNYCLVLMGTLSVYTLKQQAASIGMQGNESQWGFGQLLPLLLLILPSLTTLEIVTGMGYFHYTLHVSG